MLTILRRIVRGRRRPQHLGKYPMEMIKRVPQTTTLISDKIPRMPKRANFFMRAFHGDMGPKVKSQFPRFVNKYPLGKVMRQIVATQLPNHRGEPNPEKAHIPNDLQERADHLKALAYFMGADIVGICEVPEYSWYSHDLEGNAINPKHKYAIVMLCDQGFETTSAASGDDWISNSQSMRGYLRGSIAATTLSNYLLELGYEAQAHTNLDSDILHIPLIMKAGLGELSRIGEVVLNPFLGPRFKSSIVTTNLDLAVDLPIDFNLQNFCQSCLKCARECPVSAIPWGDKVMFNGYEMWKP
ncbi:MAG: reductive dehalogenase domain-containing protein, partial [Chloroflexota bacterium]